LWGTVAGALVAGPLGQRFGGRETLRIMAVLYVVSALGCALAWSWPSLLLFRLIGGVGIGGSSVLGPVYIAELAPARLRGRLVGMFQINIVVGILLAYFSNFCIGRLQLGTVEWRVQLGIAAVPAALFLVLLFRIPRSSRWLVTQNRLEEARHVLQIMGTPDTEKELQEIVESIRSQRSQQTESLFKRQYAFPIFLAVSIGMFNQLSGINAVLYYLNDIFAAAGFSRASGSVQAVMVGEMNLAATLLAMTLIDRIGRKKLLLFGSVGMIVALSAVARIIATRRHEKELIWFLALYTMSFAMSQGAVIWVYISEVFPNTVRAKGQSLGTSAHWIMNAIISWSFPLLASTSGAYPFVFFAAMMGLQFFVVLFFFPETKGITLEAMQAKLGISDARESVLP
jgi:SP family arabinose:H+ symporter-like MFS transporter